MIEDMQSGRSILAWWLVAACVAPCVAPCVAQQGSVVDDLRKSVERKLVDAPTQQQEPQREQEVDAADAERRFAEGDFRGAAAAFGKRLVSRRDDAALLYNLALSSWRAGDLEAAEDAIDRFASAPSGGRPDLHHGLLGNIRYRQAEALVREANGDAQPSPLQPRATAGADPEPEQKDPIQTLEAAAEKARTARDEFVRAAGDGAPTPEIARNAERALRLLQDIEKQIEEMKKQRDEQQKQNGQDQQKKDGDKQDEQQKEEQEKQDRKDQQQGEQKQDQQQDQKDPQEQQQQKDGSDSQDQRSQGEERPEPKPDAARQDEQQDKQQQEQPKQDPAKDAAADEPKGEGEEKPEPKPKDGEPKDESQDAQQAPRGDAPGEQVDATQLSTEQRARLMEQLKDLDARMREIRMQSRSRRPVDRDW